MSSKILKYLTYVAVTSSLVFSGLAFGQVWQDYGPNREFAPNDSFKSPHATKLSNDSGWKSEAVGGKAGWSRPKVSRPESPPEPVGGSSGSAGGVPVAPSAPKPKPGPIKNPPKGAKAGDDKGLGSRTIEITAVEIQNELVALIDPNKSKDCKPKIEFSIQNVTESKAGSPPAGTYLMMTDNCGFIAFIPIKANYDEAKIKSLQKSLTNLGDLAKKGIVDDWKGEQKRATVPGWYNIIKDYLDTDKLKYYYEIEKPASLNDVRKGLGLIPLESPSVLPPIEVAQGQSREIIIGKDEKISLRGSSRVIISITAEFDGKPYSGSVTKDLKINTIYNLRIKIGDASAPAGLSFPVLIRNVGPGPVLIQQIPK